MTGPRKDGSLSSTSERNGCALCKGKPWKSMVYGRPPVTYIAPCPYCGYRAPEPSK